MYRNVIKSLVKIVRSLNINFKFLRLIRARRRMVVHLALIKLQNLEISYLYLIVWMFPIQKVLLALYLHC